MLSMDCRGVTAEETFAAVLQRRLLEQGRSYDVFNRGIGGERTDQALKRLARDVTALEPQLVTVMYGTNDSYVDQGRQESRISVDEFGSGLEQIATELERRGIRVALMTEPAWGKAAGLNGVGEHPNDRLSLYMERTRRVAQKLKLPLVDHFQIWSTAATGGADIGAWTTDQCHPNPVGHASGCKFGAAEKMTRQFIEQQGNRQSPDADRCVSKQFQIC